MGQRICHHIPLTIHLLVALLSVLDQPASAFIPLPCQSTRFPANVSWKANFPRHPPKFYQPQMSRRFHSHRESNLHSPSPRWPLFNRQPSEQRKESKKSPVQNRIKVLNLRTLWIAISRVHSRLRRAFVICMASTIFWMGTGLVEPRPAQASPTIIERVMPQRDERIIDRYVRQHMFDDDTSFNDDPLESAYREAYEDYQTKGTYPRALREITSQNLGQVASRMSSGEEGFSVVSFLTKATRALQKRGLSETAALASIACLFVIAGPSLILFVGMIIGGASKRNMNRIMKQRYGDSYTVDATAKDLDDVEAPDDDEDDGNNNDDTDDDDDEDDDDDN